MTTEAQEATELIELLSKAAGDLDPSFDETAKLAAIGLNQDGTQKFKPRSMVSLNGQPLPDRVAVYRTDTGEKVMVPTAQVGAILRKRRADDPSRLAFSSKAPENPPKAPQFIEKSCDFCAEHNVTKRFPTETQYGRHMRAFHPDEWDEQRESAGALSGLLNASPQQLKALKALLNEEPAKGGK